jgi:hypothetical protein
MLHAYGMGDVAFDGSISIDATAGADGVGGTSSASGSLPSFFGNALQEVLQKVGLAAPAGGSAPGETQQAPPTVPVTTSAARQIAAFATNPIHVGAAPAAISLTHPISQEAGIPREGDAVAPVSALMTTAPAAVARLPRPVLYIGAAVAAFAAVKLYKRVQKGGLK